MANISKFKDKKTGEVYDLGPKVVTIQIDGSGVLEYCEDFTSNDAKQLVDQETIYVKLVSQDYAVATLSIANANEDYLEGVDEYLSSYAEYDLGKSIAVIDSSMGGESVTFVLCEKRIAMITL